MFKKWFSLAVEKSLALQKPDPKIVRKMTISIHEGPVFGS
jgi:hypothetical protein